MSGAVSTLLIGIAAMVSCVSLYVPIFLVLGNLSFYYGGVVPDNKSSPRIVGGHEAEPHSHPYIVSLQLRFLWVRAHLCGGTLLSDSWILTAAHCITESWLIRWLPMDAVAGLHELDRYALTSQVIPIGKRVPHPDYNGDIGPNDIAMLRTQVPFILTSNIQPARLPTNFKIDYNSLMLTGWGVLRTTSFIPDLPERLQELKVTYIPYKKCYKAINAVLEDDEENPLDQDRNICTGPIGGGYAACNGDSGGPLVQMISETDPNSAIETTTTIKNITKLIINGNNLDDKDYLKAEDPIPVIVGVVSWGIAPCGRKGAPTVYTKVSSYMDFINYNMKR